MKVLLDCSRVSTGGALQNSLSLVHNALKTPQHEWYLCLSERLRAELAGLDLTRLAATDFVPEGTGFQKKLVSLRYMPRFERRIRPHVSFSPAGPVYWRSACPQVVSFALPHLIYPEADVYAGMTLAQRVISFAIMRAARSSFRRADHLVAQTRTVLERVVRHLPYPRKRVFLVENSYSPIFAEALRKPRRHEQGSRFRFVVPTAYYPHKNLEIVPRVARELSGRGYREFEFVLTVPQETPPWRRLSALAQGLGQEARVLTAGHVPHHRLVELYSTAGAIFLPTLLECSTAVYPEAFAAAVPLATSRLDFATELCGTAAQYFDPKSVREGADALEELMVNPAKRAELVDRGRIQLRTRYISPVEKWRRQLECIEVAAHTRNQNQLAHSLG